MLKFTSAPGASGLQDKYKKESDFITGNPSGCKTLTLVTMFIGFRQSSYSGAPRLESG